MRWTHLPAGPLELRWEVEGIRQLVAPNLVDPMLGPAGRTDNLWQHTCFEMFLKGAGSAYDEFNFAPSGRWAAYAFSSYREGAGHLALDEPPAISCESGANIFTCTVLLPAAALVGKTRAGISAVIEEAGGHKSYWALAHMPDTADSHGPDFHRAECFTLPIAQEP